MKPKHILRQKYTKGGSRKDSKSYSFLLTGDKFERDFIPKTETTEVPSMMKAIARVAHRSPVEAVSRVNTMG